MASWSLPALPLPFVRLSLLLLILPLSLAAAQQQGKCDRELQSCDPSINRFPEDQQIKIKYANKTISKVKYFNNFVDVDIRTDSEGFKYRFVVCGCPLETTSGRQAIFINPLSYYIEDGPILALYHSLAPENIGFITAVQKRDFIYNSDIRDHISSGGAAEVADPNSFEIQYSKIKEANPALSIIGTFNSGDYRDAELEIPFLVAAESQESNPLARAEWMKIIGLVLDRSEKAIKDFEEIENRYNDAKDKAAKAIRRPAVFFNYPQSSGADDSDLLTLDEKYTWTQPVGDEYIVDFVRDANADYRYIDRKPVPDKSGSSNNLSTVVRDFKSADILVQSSRFPGSSTRTLEDYLNELVSGPDNADPEVKKEFEKLNAVRCANVWSQAKRVTADGMANDFLESAIFKPDVVLSDFVQALHPYLEFPNRELVYIYRYEETKSAPKKCPFTVLNGTAPNGQKYVDKKFLVPRLSRFQIADRLEGNILPAIKKRIDNRFEVFFHHEDASEKDTVVTVRVQVDAEEEKSLMNSTNVLFGVKESLGNDVKERNADGTIREDPDPNKDPAGPPEGTDDGGGLSGGAIAGIVIAVLAAVIIIGIILYKRKSSPRRPGQAPLSSDHYWDDPEVAGGGGQAEPRPFA